MRKAGRALTGLALCVLLAVFLTGCGREETKKPLNVALLIGNHANAAAPNLTAARQHIREACERFGYVSIIAVDGSPYQSAQAEIPEPKKSLSKSKLESIAASQETEIMELAKESIAKSAEVDTLKAIELGVRSLRSREEGECRMLIMDSGVCTAGSLDFTDTLLEAVDPEAVAKKLEEQSALPDMQGIEVIWAGLGDTAPPQAALSPKNTEVLKNVWGKVLEKSGAKVEFLSDLPTGPVSASSLPPVTAVGILQPISAITENGYSPQKSLVLDQQTLDFKPDSAELLSDMETLRSLLAPIADYMIKEKGYRILLCGTTATAGTQESSVELSKRRCEAVKQILVSMGVQEGQIQTIGLGYKDHPFHMEDINDDGSLNEGQARYNRRVILLPANSKIAKKVLD